jgi:transcriptional regulator with XRE-family HTH domain
LNAVKYYLQKRFGGFIERKFMKVTAEFGARIDQIAKAIGSGNILADLTGISHGTLSHWRRGKGVRDSLLYQWADTTGISLDWLIHGKGDAEKEIAKVVAKYTPPASPPSGFHYSAERAPHSEICRESAPPYIIGVSSAGHFSNALLAQIIDELSKKEGISADERLRLIAPYQRELSRRMRSSSSHS